MGKEVILKNFELLNVLSQLGEFMQVELPVKVGWNIKKNMRKLEFAFKEFGEAEQELVSKYAIKIDGKVKYKDNGQPEIYPANQDIFKKELGELQICESYVDILTINLSDLEGKNIKPSLLFNLEFMIVDDEEEKDKV